MHAGKQCRDQPLARPSLPPPCSTTYALVKDGWRIRAAGLLQGFDAATWMVIALQVRLAGGQPSRQVCSRSSLQGAAAEDGLGWAVQAGGDAHPCCRPAQPLRQAMPPLARCPQAPHTRPARPMRCACRCLAAW